MKVSVLAKLVLVTCAFLALLFPALAGSNLEPRIWPKTETPSMEQSAQIEITPMPGDIYRLHAGPSIGYDSQSTISMMDEKHSTNYDQQSEASIMDEDSSTAYNSFWETSAVKLDSHGRLTAADLDGIMGTDYDPRASNMDVLIRGLLHNGVSFILVANPKNIPIKILVNPQINNWNTQYVQVKYGNLLVSKKGNQMSITVPASQSGLIIINTPPRKRYSFTAGPKPAYSFMAGPKPPYSFRAGPKPPYSFRIGY